MKSRVTLLNVISNILAQLFTILSGFIVPKIILSYFGSNVNGLISSITQFLSYITLIEGGVTGVITATLYKPLIKKDFNKISSIMKTSEKFYRRIGLIFIIYSIILAIVYPIVFSTEFSFPCPNLPLFPNPQLKTSPFSFNARLKYIPAAICLIFENFWPFLSY
jgi:hypothetical protein